MAKGEAAWERVNSRPRLLPIFLAIEIICASISAAEYFLLDGTGYFINLLIVLLALIIMTVQAAHLIIRSYPHSSEENTKLTYPLFDSILMVILGIVFITIGLYFSKAPPDTQWQTLLFITGIWLVGWAALMIVIKRYTDRLIANHINAGSR